MLAAGPTDAEPGMTTPARHRWHILGAGAIGCLLAASLQRAGIDIALLCRDRERQRRLAAGLEIREGRGHRVVRLPAASVADRGALRAVLVTTKAHDVEQAVAGIAGRLASGARVVLLHNGLGVFECVRARFPACDFYCGTTTDAAHFDAAGRLVRAGRGAARIGQPGRRAAPGWFAEFAAARDSIRWTPDIEQSLWRKLLVNAAINPLAAIHDCRNGELLSNPDYRLRAEAVCRELAELARARGYPRLAGEVWPLVREVMASTAANRNSMQQDIARGRRSEVDFITGYVCRSARRLGVACPENEALWRQVRRLERRA